MIGTLGFRNDDAFKVWCERCVEKSFQLFFVHYQKLRPDYKRRLSKAERDTVVSLASDAYKADVRRDPCGMLKGDCEFDFPWPGQNVWTKTFLVLHAVNRLEAFALFAVEVMVNDNQTHAKTLNDSNFLCEQPVGFTQKMRGLVMLAQFLLDCNQLNRKLSPSGDALESDSEDDSPNRAGFWSLRENMAVGYRQRELQVGTFGHI